ncbi:hypothetical protein E2C01_081169 [Portunus trituberculatus]|uniref:Uncharacterized protein n=1 Tax=Portunus trituberculatus TaxID=210409 RepID=A0A5B7IXA1_PORTR|nr:hypothetical protein [Portunus trituberculatus]
MLGKITTTAAHTFLARYHRWMPTFRGHTRCSSRPRPPVLLTSSHSAHHPELHLFLLYVLYTYNWNSSLQVPAATIHQYINCVATEY